LSGVRGKFRPPPPPGRQPEQDDRPQGVLDPRETNTGHGKKTADKWTSDTLRRR
jgi:hypothetical protein